MIVDQRPSGIDNEILSQVGTRITALLNDDKDIDAVFTGVSGGNSLKTVLSQMDPKQQAMILGYAVPMPRAGRWIEKINSDALTYGGTGLGNGGSVIAISKDAAGQPAEVTLTLPPMATLILEFSAT